MRTTKCRIKRSASTTAAGLSVAALGAAATLSMGAGAAFAGTTQPSACPTSGFNLCIAPQGANEAVMVDPGNVVRAGYEFTIPGSNSTTKVAVFNAYESLTVTCANGSTPTQGYVNIPMPDATYHGPFGSSWVPAGGQSSLSTYQGSIAMPNLCNGTTMDVGQPGNMMFVAQVYADTTATINFQSHYNDSPCSRSGSWSATKSVTPDPISSSSVLPPLGGWAIGGGVVVLVGAGLGTGIVLRRRQMTAETY